MKIKDINHDNLIKSNNYKRYYSKKEKIKERYPDSLLKIKRNKNIDERKVYKAYLKEVCDLMERDKDFQKFIWEINEK